MSEVSVSPEKWGRRMRRMGYQDTLRSWPHKDWYDALTRRGGLSEAALASDNYLSQSRVNEAIDELCGDVSSWIYTHSFTSTPAGAHTETVGVYPHASTCIYLHQPPQVHTLRLCWYCPSSAPL